MTGAELLGLYFVDRRRAQSQPRVFELRQYLNGVYLIADAQGPQLITQAAIEAHADDLFETYDEAIASCRREQPPVANAARAHTLLQTIENLTADQQELLALIISLDDYRPHAFKGGVLAGRTMDAVSLLDLQIATGIPLRTLVDAIVSFKKLGLLEVVSEPGGETPNEEEYWLIVNPDALQALQELEPLEDVA